MEILYISTWFPSDIPHQCSFTFTDRKPVVYFSQWHYNQSKREPTIQRTKRVDLRTDKQLFHHQHSHGTVYETHSANNSRRTRTLRSVIRLTRVYALLQIPLARRWWSSPIRIQPRTEAIKEISLRSAVTSSRVEPLDNSLPSKQITKRVETRGNWPFQEAASSRADIKQVS